MQNFLSDKTVVLLLASYILLMFVGCFFIIPCWDNLYYFTWSNNLQLSYFDGPPLIAYLIWLLRSLFGDNVFTLNFLGEICILASTYYFYKIMKLVVDNNSKFALLSAMLFAVYPFATTRFMYITVTYDGLEMLFLLTILYHSIVLMNSPKVLILYKIGFLSGLMLLSKYSGIFFILPILLYFAIIPRYRFVYRSIHLYLAMLLCVLVFSPVLVWNYHNGWQSFIYQSTSHNWTGKVGDINDASKAGWNGVKFYLFSSFLGVCHILVILICFSIYKLKSFSIKDNIVISFIWFIFICNFIFWLYKSPTSHVAMNYMLPIAALSIMILMGLLHKIIHTYIHTYIRLLILLCILISTVMIVNQMFFSRSNKTSLDKLELLKINKLFIIDRDS